MAIDLPKLITDLGHIRRLLTLANNRRVNHGDTEPLDVEMLKILRSAVARCQELFCQEAAERVVRRTLCSRPKRRRQQDR